MLLEKVKVKLLDECHLQPSALIVLGVSGGADSMALLHILIKCGFRPLAAHFNHQIRPSAQEDADFVQRAAERYGLDFILGSQDVPGLAEREGQSLEEAARNARYRFLFSLANERKAAAVAVAHQADDQVETILMNLLRGSGLNGLGGMRLASISAYHPAIPLIRPFLDCWREEIIEYCRQEGLEYVSDETNQDSAYRRNRIRLELLPQLETYNPQIKNSLLQLSKLAAADLDLLDGIIEDAKSACALKLERGYAAIDLTAFRKQSAATQRYLIRNFLETCFPDERDFGSWHFEKARRIFAREARSLNLKLNGNVLLRVEQGKGIVMSPERAQKPEAEWPQIMGRLKIETQTAEIKLAAGWKLGIALLERDAVGEDYRNNQDLYQAYLDAGKLAGELTVRAWKAGDRYQPLGMGGASQKISDIWINKKIPLRAKKFWPLLCSSNEIVWIPGSPPAESVKISAATTRIFYLRVYRA